MALMRCPQCHTPNSDDALNCTLCGAVLHTLPATEPTTDEVPPAPVWGIYEDKLRDTTIVESEAAQPWAFRPLPALGIGLLLVPLIKQVWIPNYMFNFLATLIHEIGHTVFAWIMGMPAIPGVSLFGDGGATPVFSQIPALCFVVLAGMVWFAWRVRDERRWLIATAITMIVYALLAFTNGAHNLVVAGGVLFEIGGSVACLYWALTASMSTGLERPLYALWGWWMLINRSSETWLMLRDRSYWDEHIIKTSGIGEGMVNDLPQLCDSLNLSPNTVLTIVLLLCLSAVPIAFGLARLKRLYRD